MNIEIIQPEKESPTRQLRRHMITWTEFFDSRIAAIAKGAVCLCGFLLIMVLILAMSVAGQKQEIRRLNKQAESFDRRIVEINKRLSAMEDETGRIGQALEKRRR